MTSPYTYSLYKASTHLIWSVFGLTDLEKMESQEQLSSTVVGVLYVLFLIISVIMLVNMLVALLTNTYDKVEVSKELTPINTNMNNFLHSDWLGEIQTPSILIGQRQKKLTGGQSNSISMCGLQRQLDGLSAVVSCEPSRCFPCI